MSLARRFSLRSRLTAFAAIGAIVVFGAGALLLYRDLSHSLSSAITAELAVRVDDLDTRFTTGVDAEATSGVLAQAVSANGLVLSPAGERPLLTSDELRRAAGAE